MMPFLYPSSSHLFLLIVYLQQHWTQPRSSARSSAPRAPCTARWRRTSGTGPRPAAATTSCTLSRWIRSTIRSEDKLHLVLDEAIEKMEEENNMIEMMGGLNCKRSAAGRQSKIWVSNQKVMDLPVANSWTQGKKKWRCISSDYKIIFFRRYIIICSKN